MNKHPLIPILSFLTALCFAAQAGAAEDEEKELARKHFDAGVTLLENEDFEGAAAEFETSVSIYPTRNALFNLANCLKALHRYGEALEKIEQLKSQFKDELDQKWQQEVTNLEQVVRSVIGALFVHVNVQGATIQVDGQEVAKSPMVDAVTLGPGDHEVSVSMEGYETQTRTVKLVSGKKSIESFELSQPSSAWVTINANVAGAAVFIDGNEVGVVPLAKHQLTPGEHLLKLEHPGHRPIERKIILASGETKTLDLTLEPAEVASAVGTTVGSGEKGSPEKGRKRRIATPIVLALAGAAGVGAIVTGVIHLKKVKQIKEDCDGNDCPSNLSDKGDRAHKLAVATNVLISVAAVGVVAGTILAFVEGRERPDTQSVSVTPEVAPSGAGISIRGRF